MTTPRRRPGRLLDRLLDRRPGAQRAVLRLADARRNVMPLVCARSGAPTDHAAPVRAVQGAHVEGWVVAVGVTLTAAVARLARRGVTTVDVPIAEAVWRTWQARLRVAVAVTSAGIALVLIGAMRGIAPLVVFGVGLSVLGWLNRVRAWNNAWIGAVYRPGEDDVVLSRVHPTFDREAAAIYRRSVSRRT